MILISRLLVQGSYVYFLIPVFVCGVLFIFLKQFEFFILLVLIINEEFFYLVPRQALGNRQLQGLLYVILFTLGIAYFFRDKRSREIDFSGMVIALLFISCLGVLNSFFHGQPLVLGVKAAKGYALVLFYFIFMSKDIKTEKLLRFVVMAGVALTFLNNLQFVLHGRLNLFHVAGEMERAGQLRFLIGDYFMIFSPLMAFSEYLKSKKKLYLLAFVYITATVIIQGQTRAVMWGFFVTVLILLYVSRQVDLKKAVLIGIPGLILLIWIAPLIQSTFLGELYLITKNEIAGRGGNVGVRFDTYDYYLREIKKSPIIGRGIWNEAFDIYMGNNPEDVKYRGIHLSDIGLTSLLFHAGLIGAIWLTILLIKVYKSSFSSRGRIRHPGFLGPIAYFVFGLATMVTLNTFVHHRTIIYLALVLAVLSQVEPSLPETGKAD